MEKWRILEALLLFLWDEKRGMKNRFCIAGVLWVDYYWLQLIIYLATQAHKVSNQTAKGIGLHNVAAYEDLLSK